MHLAPAVPCAALPAAASSAITLWAWPPQVALYRRVAPHDERLTDAKVLVLLDACRGQCRHPRHGAVPRGNLLEGLGPAG